MPLTSLASGWESHSRPSDPIQMWALKRPDAPYNLVRAEISIAAPILPLLALIQDATHQHHWIPHAHQVHILSKPTANQTLVHFQSHKKWPFKARDAITLFDVSQPGKNQIKITMTNQPEALPTTKHFVRIQALEGEWQLTAEKSCQTHLRYVAGSIGGGVLPRWFVDKLNFSTSMETLENLKKWAMEHYQEYKVDDLTYSYLDPVPLHQHCQR